MIKLLNLKKTILIVLVLGISGEIFSNTENTRSLEQVGVVLHGGNPLVPTSESLVGQYLASTQSSSVVRTFINGPGGTEGVQKLAISLSRESFSEFLRIFGDGSSLSKNLFFIHHTPSSGTFYQIYKGKSGSYTRIEQAAKFASSGTLLIPILLDDQEALRLENFFRLGAFNENLARSPWDLIGPKGRYSAMSEFIGCTNWVGQIPIGEKKVAEYIFPSGDDGEYPLHRPLRPYNTPANMSSEREQILRSVWTIPGHQQLGELLDPAGFRAGYFANVGWLAHVALGRLNLDRSPIMFYEVADHKAPLPVDFPLKTNPH